MLYLFNDYYYYFGSVYSHLAIAQRAHRNHELFSPGRKRCACVHCALPRRRRCSNIKLLDRNHKSNKTFSAPIKPIQLTHDTVTTNFRWTYFLVFIHFGAVCPRPSSMWAVHRRRTHHPITLFADRFPLSHRRYLASVWRNINKYVTSQWRPTVPKLIVSIRRDREREKCRDSSRSRQRRMRTIVSISLTFVLE